MMTREQVERRVLSICSDVLQVDELACRRDLYSCGATSFSVIFIMARLQEELGVQLPQQTIVRIFRGNPGVTELASELHGIIQSSSVR